LENVKISDMRQGVVWSKNKDKLDKSEDKIYIINQVLMFGNLGEIKALVEEYGENEVRRVFTEQPTKIYSKPAFNLIKNYILKIDKNLDGGRYIQSVY